MTARNTSFGAGIGGGNGSAKAGTPAYLSISPTATVAAYSNGSMPAIHAGNNYSGGYYVNAVLNTAVSQTTTFKPYSGASNTQIADLTLPAGYRAFAFTAPAGTVRINAYNASGVLVGNVVRSSDGSAAIPSITMLDGYTAYQSTPGTGWLPVKLGSLLVEKDIQTVGDVAYTPGMPVHMGDEIVYRIEVSNRSTVQMLNVLVKETLPGGTWSIVSGSAEPLGVNMSIPTLLLYPSNLTIPGPLLWLLPCPTTNTSSATQMRPYVPNALITSN